MCIGVSNPAFVDSPKFSVSSPERSPSLTINVLPVMNTEWCLFGDIKLNSLSVVLFCSGLDGDGEGEEGGERRQTWES